MITYVLNEGTNVLYESNDLDMVSHELLSIIKSRVTFLLNNNILCSQNFTFSDLTINKVNCDGQKRYKLVEDKYSYVNGYISTSQNTRIYSSSPYVNELLNSISEMLQNTISIRQQTTTVKQNQRINTVAHVNEPLPQQKTDSIKDLLKNTTSLLTESVDVSTLDTKTLINEKMPVVNVIKKDGTHANNDDLVNALTTDEDSSDDEIDSEMLEKIKQQIEELTTLKEKEEDKLDDVMDIHQAEANKYSDFVCELNDSKRKIKEEQEKEEQRRRIFESDKSSYSRIKKDVLSGKLSEDKLPPLFTDKFPIFKFMETQNLLNIEGDYAIYTELYNKMYPKQSTQRETGYVPHNVNYLSKDEQDKYASVLDKNKDLIGEFVNSQRKSNIPSLESLLEDSDYSESDEESCSESEHLEVDEIEEIEEDDSEIRKEDLSATKIDEMNVKVNKIKQNDDLLDKMASLIEKGLHKDLKL
jgi:hypothetical protein